MKSVSLLVEMDRTVDRRQHRAQSELPYQPGLDGLRALAVAAVFLYHLELVWAPGGFLGVEVFFVISGYLITTLLVAEWHRAGSVDLKAFWLRRARRLLPALFAVLAGSAWLAWLLAPSQLERLRSEVYAAFGYVTNWFLIARELPYFEAFSDPPVLQHLWSLAVEEQFYILWPMLVGGAFLLLRGRRTRRTRLALALLVLAASAGAAALMWILYDPLADPSRLYYGTDTRAGGLLLGAALAFVWRPWLRRRPEGAARSLMIDGLGFAALAGLVALFVLINEYGEFLYRGGFILTGLATATAIGVVVRPGSLLGRAIGVPPMRWLGTRSYGVYLWHWPVIVFGGPYLASQLGSEWAGPVAIAATLVVAELSYRYVEGRFRRPSQSGQIRLGWLRPQWMGLAVATVGATALAFVVPTGLISEQPLMASVAVSGISSSSSGSVELADLEPKVPSDEATSFVVQSPVVLPGSSTDAAVSQDPRATASVARSLAQASGLPWGQTEAQVEAAKLKVLAIGDSVMRGAAGRLVTELGEEATIDAEVNRQFTAGIRLLDRLRVRDALPDVVVVHLGTNSAINPSHFGEMMTVLEDVPRVVFVTVRVPRRYEGVVNGILEEGVLQWPNAVLADWYGFSDDQQGYFVRDGVHLTATGADAYVGLIVETIQSSPAEPPESAA